MSYSTPAMRTRRLGVLFGYLLTLVCATASVTVAYGLLSIRLRSSEDLILLIIGVLGAVLLARLCIICLGATCDVWNPERIPSTSNSTSSSRARMGLAKWLLTAAALLSPATASAAAPAASTSISATVPQAANNDPYWALESAQSGTATNQIPATPTDHGRETDCPSIPEPDWTLPLGSPQLGCRVLGGGAPRPSHSPRTHVVQRGETVWGIAASYLPRSAGNAQIAASVNSWIKANPLTLAHPDLIQVGDTLTVPTV